MDRLESLLHDLVSRSPEIKGAVLVTLDGFPISHAPAHLPDVERQAAVIASLASLAARSTKMVGMGGPEEILITAQEGRMFVYHVEDLAALGVLTVKDITAGLVLLKIRQMLPELVRELKDLINVGGGGI